MYATAATFLKISRTLLDRGVLVLAPVAANTSDLPGLPERLRNTSATKNSEIIAFQDVHTRCAPPRC